MNRYLSDEKISIFLQLLQVLIALLGVIFKVRLTVIGFLLVSSSIIAYLVCKQVSINRYIKFIEFLMNNNRHNFVLLPKLRMYLRSENISNKIKINQLNAIYYITKNPEKDLIGDLEINYRLNIENRNIPNQIDFISGNDYSSEQQIMLYKYGTITKFQEISPRKQLAVPYWKGLIRHYPMAIERHNITQSDDLEFCMKVKCKESFDFKNLGRDTIVCLPKIFSDDIKTVKYNIILDGFEDNIFYCSSYKISEDNKKFKITNIETNQTSKTSFEVECHPNDVRGEKAYYIRVGLNSNDEEYYL